MIEPVSDISPDCTGNTTKALTKGYAVGSAAFSAFSPFSAHMAEIVTYTRQVFEIVNIARINVFVGARLVRR